jgi:hypothetical protein
VRRLTGGPDQGIRSVELVIELRVRLVVFIFIFIFVVVVVVVEFLLVELFVGFVVIIVWILQLERLVQFGKLELVDAEPTRARS